MSRSGFLHFLQGRNPSSDPRPPAADAVSAWSPTTQPSQWACLAGVPLSALRITGLTHPVAGTP
jgi:hypothetical protein